MPNFSRRIYKHIARLPRVRCERDFSDCAHTFGAGRFRLRAMLTTNVVVTPAAMDANNCTLIYADSSKWSVAAAAAATAATSATTAPPTMTTSTTSTVSACANCVPPRHARNSKLGGRHRTLEVVQARSSHRVRPRGGHVCQVCASTRWRSQAAERGVILIV